MFLVSRASGSIFRKSMHSSSIGLVVTMDTRGAAESAWAFLLPLIFASVASTDVTSTDLKFAQSWGDQLHHANLGGPQPYTDPGRTSWSLSRSSGPLVFLNRTPSLNSSLSHCVYNSLVSSGMSISLARSGFSPLLKDSITGPRCTSSC